MRKDINFIESGELLKQRTTTNTTGLIVFVGVFMIVALMTFMFFTSKATNKELKAQISEIENQLEDPAAQNQIKEFEKLKKTYESMLSATLTTSGITNSIEMSNVLSAKIINTIYKETGARKIDISNFVFAGRSISVEMSTKNVIPDDFTIEEFVIYMKTNYTHIFDSVQYDPWSLDPSGETTKFKMTFGIRLGGVL